jgi:hypothetical protein
MDNFAAALIKAMAPEFQSNVPPRAMSLHIKLYLERLRLAEQVRAATQLSQPASTAARTEADNRASGRTQASGA